MHRDDKGGSDDQLLDIEQEETGKTLEWLLDRELSEPVDALFGLADDGGDNTELTAREAAVASRPMFGSNTSADDLSAYVEEEIVLSGDTSSDIYNTPSRVDSDRPSPRSSAGSGPIMAIDHRRQQGVTGQPSQSFDDGLDILGLTDDDDIGSRPLSLQRSRRTPVATPAARPAGVADTATPATVHATGAAADGGLAQQAPDTPAELGQVAPALPDDLDRAELPAEEPPASEALLELDSDLDDFDLSGLEDAAMAVDERLPTLPDLPAALDLASAAWSDEPADEELASGGSPGDSLDLEDVAELDLSIDFGGADGLAPVADPLAHDGLPAHEPAAIDSGWDLEAADETAALDALAASEGVDDIESIEAVEGVIALEVEEDFAAIEVEEDFAALDAMENAGPRGTFEEIEAIEAIEGIEATGEMEDIEAIEAIEEIDAIEVIEAVAVAPEVSPGDDAATDTARPVEGAASDAADVLSYVSRCAPPTDDSEFDRYLLRGEHLSDSSYDIESLEVETTEGVVSVDPALDTNLDYHQDFSLPQYFNPQTVAVLTAVLAPTMEEVSAAVESRLVQLGLPPESVALDTMLAIDPLSRRQCAEEGFEPVILVCPTLPQALASLQPQEQEALYLRLVLRESGRACNDLLQADFVLPEPDAEEALGGFNGPFDPAFAASFDFELGGGAATDSFALDVESANDAGFAPGAEAACDATGEEESSDRAEAQDDGNEIQSHGTPDSPEALGTAAAWAALDDIEVAETDTPAEDFPDVALAAAGSDGIWASLDGAAPEGALADPADAGDVSEIGEHATLEPSAAGVGEAALDDSAADEASFPDLAPALDDWLGEDDTADDSGLLAVLAETAAEEPLADLDELSWPGFDAGEGGELDPVAAALDAQTDDPAEESIPPGEAVDGSLHVFSDDDLDDWELETAPAAEADVEQLLESLGGFESDISDICGVAVGEFGESEGDVTTAPRPLREVAAAPAPAVSDQPAPEEAGAASAPALSWCVPANIRFNAHIPSGGEVFRDFLDAFLEEGAVELEKLEDAIGQWERDVDSPAGSDTVPRVLHTLKGIAKGVGLQCYGTLIHNFETLLSGLARPAPGGEEGYFRIINAWLDAAVKGFEHIQATESDVLSELPQSEAGVRPAAVDPLAAVAADTEHRPAPAPMREKQQDKQLADEGAKVLAAQQTIRMTSEAVDNLLNLSNQAQQLGVKASQSTFRSKRAGAELLARLSSVRSHITKIADRALANVTARGGQMQNELDALEMDQYSELQEAASILREAVEDLDDLIHVSSRQSSSAEALLKQQASVITSLGSAIRDARVMPVSRLMPGLRRIVRTVGADLGKLVNFQVLNESGKLDRDSHVCCQIILEHMVRNALDHGIEPPEQRRALGKPETGLVTIEVSKEGSDYLIRLSDDGRGMDPDALREAALDRGLDVNVAELSDREALRLIFHKGFSTAARLSEISGRGVGMDIVLSELQQIGGEIDIQSTLGQGTTFTVRVPSNVNVNGALLVNAGEAAYAIPLDGLKAIEHVPVADFYQAISNSSRLTVFDLDCEPAYLATLCNGDKLPDPTSWGATLPVIIAGTEERYMAIAVDDVTEALELVIRSMGSQFSQVPGVAGGATTSDGQAIVALDLNALVRSIATSEVSPVVFEREKSERLLVLVVDDSRTQRMVATSQFDTLGVETVTAENGMVAIDLLNTTPRLPDVVLLDVEMPVKDGIQTLREIRRSARYKHLPVIMVTSRTGPKHRALAQEAGCNGYMGKPFNFPVLVEQIAQLTGYPLQIN